MHRATLFLATIGILGGFGHALTGAGQQISLQAPPVPAMEAVLDDGLDLFKLEAWNGMPGSPGVFNFLVLSGPVQGLFSIGFTFDGDGHAMVAIPFSALNNGYDIVAGIQLVAIGMDAAPHASPLWALASRNYIVTDPEVSPCTSCPTGPGSWIDYVPWPGSPADGSIYPHTLVAFQTGEARGSGQPMLALESGPAGSFPIN
jgi:hypothetical protein